MTASELDRALQRCTCEQMTVEPVPEIPQVLRCIDCGGWVTLRVMNEKDMAEAIRWFPPKPEDDE
jgi:hypothetical protein